MIKELIIFSLFWGLLFCLYLQYLISIQNILKTVMHERPYTRQVNSMFPAQRVSVCPSTVFVIFYQNSELLSFGQAKQASWFDSFLQRNYIFFHQQYAHVYRHCYYYHYYTNTSRRIPPTFMYAGTKPTCMNKTPVRTTFLKKLHLWGSLFVVINIRKERFISLIFHYSTLMSSRYSW